MAASAPDTDDAGEAPRVVARTIRGDVRATAVRIFLYTLLAWVLSYFFFTYFTEAGQLRLQLRGFLPTLLTWLLLSALIAAGHTLGYVIMTRITLGQRPFTADRVVRLAAGDAAAAMGGGYALGFLALTLMLDAMVLIGWAAVAGFFFSYAALAPKYTAQFAEAVRLGDIVRD